MMLNAARRTFLTAASALVLGPLAHAGTVMETESRAVNASSKQVDTIKTYAQNDRLRVESSAGDAVMLFKDDALYHLSPGDKTYIVMDRAAMKRMADTINPALKQLQEQLANMPPEQRAQIEKMIGQQTTGGAKAKPQQVRKTGRSGKVAGYGCSYVEIVEAGAVKHEACVAAPDALKGGEELMSAARKMSTLVQDMMSGIDAPWLQDAANNQVATFEKLGGVPVMMRTFDSGAPAHEMQVKSIRTETLPASLFEVPAGYTRKDIASTR